MTPGASSDPPDWLRSTGALTSPVSSLAEPDARADAALARPRMRVSRLPLAGMREWAFDPATGDLAHRSGGFFRVEGLRADRAAGPVSAWDQPIVHQPEIGILGFLMRRIGGIPHLWVQFKEEPGNPASVQISPTVQATRSNYTRVHGGRLPLYLDSFLDPDRGRIRLDRLQSEQGARFLGKRNRNMIVEIDEDPPPHPAFCWMTRGQRRRAAGRPGGVNMDARSVIACLELAPRAGRPGLRRALERNGAPDAFQTPPSAFGLDLLRSLAAGESGRHDFAELLDWFTGRKMARRLRVRRLPLLEVAGWRRDEDAIRHESGDHFSVIAVRVRTDSREVGGWDQPLVAHPETGVIGFLVRRFDGRLHALVRATAEPGTFDGVEIGPTAVCAAPRRRRAANRAPPFLDALLDPEPGALLSDTVQSEEGGRFHRVCNRYRVVEAPGGVPDDPPPDYRWMSFGQLQSLARFGHHLSVEARSLLACLDYLPAPPPEDPP